MLIGITGCSGSGKSQLTHVLQELLGADNCTVFTQDNYYITRALQPKDENGISNFDLPQSLNLEKYVADLRLLISGQNLIQQKYLFNNPQAVAETIEIKTAKYIITEGLFVFHRPEIIASFNYKIFVKTDPETSFNRRLHRDEVERGYNFEDVNYRFYTHVLPCYNQFIEPHQTHCHRIFDNSKNDMKALYTEAEDILKELAI
jgi:uridine kinase